VSEGVREEEDVDVYGVCVFTCEEEECERRRRNEVCVCVYVRREERECRSVCVVRGVSCMSVCGCVRGWCMCVCVMEFVCVCMW